MKKISNYISPPPSAAGITGFFFRKVKELIPEDNTK